MLEIFIILVTMEEYKVITPEGIEISVEEFMETEFYRKKLKQRINSFLTDEKEEELISLIKKK